MYAKGGLLHNMIQDDVVHQMCKSIFVMSVCCVMPCIDGCESEVCNKSSDFKVC